MRPSRRARRHLPWLAVLVGYAGTRVFYASLGITFDTNPLRFFWQYLDPVLLREHLWQSVFYQHIQPPLFNLYLGLGLKLDHPHFFHAAAIAFGLMLHLSIFALARRLWVRPWLAATSAIAFALSPASILMETWLFYTYPVAALLVFSAVLLHRGLRESSWALFFALFTMALIVLTRSLFHLVWMLAVTALVLFAARRKLRALAIALIPLALAGSVYAKNWVVFGRPVASTWMGFSLSRLTTTKLDPTERAELMRDGTLSDLARFPPWMTIERYPSAYREVPEKWAHIPVLSEPMHEDGIHPNFNHGAYVHIAELFAHDARVVLEREPELYWDNVQHAWQLHFLPIHDYTFFHDRRRAAGPKMRAVEQLYEAATGSGFADWDGEEPMPAVNERPGWLWAVATVLALLVALRLAWRRRRARAESATLLFSAMTIVFVGLVGNSLEVGENNRFRFLSEPLTWVLVTLMLERLLTQLEHVWRAARYRLGRALRSLRAPSLTS